MPESLELEIIVKKSRLFPDLWEAKVSERYASSPFAMVTAVHPTNAIGELLHSIARAHELRESEIRKESPIPGGESYDAPISSEQPAP